MSIDGDDDKKGFAGLNTLISDVKVEKPTPPPQNPTPAQQSQAAAETTQQATSPQIYSGNTAGGSSPPSRGKYWLAIGAIVLLFILFGGSKKEQSTPTHSSAPSSSPSQVSSQDSNREETPPVGSGLTFNQAQIRYCLSEKVRIDAWQGGVNNYSQSSVDGFNAAVNDYNSRCSNFRYRRGSLETVQTSVNSNRRVLELQGLNRAANNP